MDINSKKIFVNFEKDFDVIFMDPPYKDKNLNNLLKNILDAQILKKNGIIVIHRHKNEQEIIPKDLSILEEKKYGLSKIIFLSASN